MKVLNCFLLYVCISVSVSMAQEVDTKSIDYGKSLLDVQPESAFTNSTLQALPRHVRSESRNLLGFRLRGDALPFASSNLQVKTYSAVTTNESDLILYIWNFQGTQLKLLENRNVVRLSLPTSEAKEMLADVVKLEGQDFRGSYQINVPWPSQLKEGVEFSTNSSKDLNRLLSWHDRLDFYVEEGLLHVLIYKKVPQLFGYQRGDVWFSQQN